MGLLEAIIMAGIMFILVGATVSGQNISFARFDVNDDTSRFLLNNSVISSSALAQALELTPDTENSDPQYSLSNKSGRALLKTKFTLYEGNKTASFNTSFVFNIRPTGESRGGEGMAFIITSHEYFPNNSYGKWLGLFNDSTNDLNSSKVLAVEFDTRKSPGTNDPDDNHVGINVNSINSTIFKSLDENQNHINLKGGNDTHAWILYDGHAKKLDVYLANKSGDCPSQPLVSSMIDLSSGVLDKEAYFGFSASTGVDKELNCLKSWNLTIETVSLPNRSSPNRSSPNRELVIALSVSLPLAIVAGIGIIVLLKFRKSQAKEANKLSDEIDKIPGRLREFRYKDLKKATSNFSPAALLGSGGSGTVYKGILTKGKNVVAVKRISKDSKRGKEEFISEIGVINRLGHRNLVPLLGWCHEKGELILVYEYMPNGSLDKHIFNDDIASRFLDWDQRYNIVSGVASALLYLHEECEHQVIHRDVKASNIMLDSEFNARLGDFGLARLIEHDRRSFTATGVAGTMGYIAPECFHSGRFTAESDVFGFGAVALEVTCGRPPTFYCQEASDLVGWVWKLYSKNRLLEAADTRPNKFGSINVNEEDIKRLLMLGLACSNPKPEARPTIREVTQILARTMPAPYVSHSRPAFIWSHLSSDATTSFTISSVNSSGSVPSSTSPYQPSSHQS